MSILKRRKTITLGSDPEFAVLRKNGQLVVANQVINSNIRRGRTRNASEFGLDGNSSTAEIRPKPAKSPKQATQMIKRLLERNKTHYPEAYQHELKATTSELSLGGHIHFGNTDLVTNSGVISSVGMTLTNNLDNLLAFPSMYIENEADATTRRGRGHGYGKLTDVRVQPYGGFEYRALSSFLASEELTSCILHLAHAIADATLNSKLKSKEIVKTKGFTTAFDQQYRELLKPLLPYVFKQHKTLPLYNEKSEYKTNIDFFQKAVKAETPLFEVEIKKGWNIDFDIADFWKTDNIETLLENIIRLLISIHEKKVTSFKPVKFQFVTGSYKDLGCVEIANRVNVALNNLLSDDLLKSPTWTKLSIYGLRGSRGNEIWFSSEAITEKKKQEQLVDYLWSIARGHTEGMAVEDITIKDIYAMRPPSSMAFGKKLREENQLIAETMVIVAILMMNRSLFSGSEKVKGKKKKLLVTKNKVVGTVTKELEGSGKFKAKFPLTKTDKLPNIKLPTIFDLDKSYQDLRGSISKMVEQASIGDIQDIGIECREEFKDKFQGLLTSTCIQNRGELGACTQSLSRTPLIQMCPTHLAKHIYQLTKIIPPLNTAWDLVFLPDTLLNCNNCGEEIMRKNICTRCENCKDECCRCDNCNSCGNSIEEYCEDCDSCEECCSFCGICDSHDCTHFECETCHGDVDYSEQCDDCDVCNECCECIWCEACDGNITDTEHCDNNHCEVCCECEPDDEPDEPSLTTSSPFMTMVINNEGSTD